METIKDGANFVGNKVSELTNTASKEGNKEVAKDSNASLGTRATAAKDAVGDKMNESSSAGQAEVDKQKLKH